ncbi:MAG: NAD(P)/FAD-dependent oxidoreductase [Planctomycetes bacterium]|nr:NAD(P)/FAD-dependent oxidoreductase [Planctomycetota bacterium]
METCDVLIVGGGPAGSTCAWKLRQAGMDVVIMDKKAFPRDKTCAGWITPAVVEELQLDTADYARSRVFQPITGFRAGTIGGKVTEAHYDHPVSYGIRRREFDHYLLERSGARLRLGEKLDTIEQSAEGWTINGAIRAPLLIGAGGHFCPIAKRLGGAEGKETVVAAQEIEFELSESQMADCKVSETTPELYFCPDLKGYAWCFRKGGYLNVGLGREDNVRISEHVAAFCDWMKSQGRIPRDTPVQFHGHAYILYGHAPRPLVADAALLIGDAAGLAYPESGEGIRPAIESALIAARVIVDAQGDYSRANLEPYQRRLIARLGKREPAGAASSFLPEKLTRTLAAHLLATHWFVRHVVLDRWFLHTQQRALAL